MFYINGKVDLSIALIGAKDKTGYKILNHGIPFWFSMPAKRE